MNLLDTIATLRSLGFGGLLGSGVTGLLYLVLPDLFPGVTVSNKIGLDEVLVIGGLIGSGSHQLIDFWFCKGFLLQASKFVGYYSKLLQLASLRKHLDEAFLRRLVHEMTEEYFLGDRTRKPK